VVATFATKVENEVPAATAALSFAQVVKSMDKWRSTHVRLKLVDGTLDYPKLHAHVRRKEIRKSSLAQLDSIHQKPVHNIVSFCKELSNLQAVGNKDNLGAGDSSRIGNGL
jgi:hypothetical protein